MNLQFIADRRREKAISQKDMAKILGLSNASVYCKCEKGVYKFKADTLPLLAEVLGCQIKDFF